MNSDFDITLHSDASSASNKARSHFLDSIGLGEEEQGGSGETQGERIAPNVDGGLYDCLEDGLEESLDEGVVLSSQPEEFDFLMDASGSAGERPVSYSPGSSSEQTRTGAASSPQEDRFPVSAEGPETKEIPPDKSAALEELLTLECPECRRELALQRRHLGIEGLCVWCHTPIVAAESPRDSTVRVFPVLGRIATPPTSPADSPVAADAGADDAAGSPGTVVADEQEEPAEDPERPEFELPVELSAPPVSFSEPSPEHR
ncbi:MAG: hypothetical protein GXX91_09860 [Verrucomicrobiaceae bacterium]|nr:hypothetical protein [Verrucomicrobiaceae bacterium]